MLYWAPMHFVLPPASSACHFECQFLGHSAASDGSRLLLHFMVPFLGVSCFSFCWSVSSCVAFSSAIPAFSGVGFSFSGVVIMQ